MTSKNEKDRSKQIQDRCQNILNQLLKDEDNKYCVDCDAKGPRWASWNLGIFLCIRCAGIHRNLGVHISKVKSVNLDSWTPEQVVSLQQMGNSRARAVYEANLPDSFRRPQTDTAIEAFVRAKYEQKKYIAREWVPPQLPKVNWDKEIDEEMEKQKRKKKSSTTSTISSLPTANTEKKSGKTSDFVPQPLPKPKLSVSPKPGRISAKIALNETKIKDGIDLLGLDNSSAEQKRQEAQDDIFSGFLSGPEGKIPNAIQGDNNFNSVPEKPADLNLEEQSFFNQPAPTDKEKSKMTKDSILALYNQMPSQPHIGAQFNGTTTNQSVYNQNFQSNQFAQASFQQPGSNFNQGMSYQIPANGAVPVQSNNYVGQVNQFAPASGQYPQQNAYKYPQNQYVPTQLQQNAFSQFPNGSSQPNSSSNGLQTNMFGTNQMTQQFSSLGVSQGNIPNFASFPNTQAGSPFTGNLQNISTANSWK